MKNIKYFLPLLALPILMSCKSSNVQVKVTLNFNNCEPSKTISVKKGSLLKIDDPIKDRCNFLWWKLGDDKFDLTTPINNDITLDAHYMYDAENIFKDIEHAEVRHNNANLRVMSFNLLVSIYNNHPHHHGYNPINDPYPQGVDDGRDYQALDTIKHFLPDVVGLQECDQSSDDTEERQKEDNGWYDFFDYQNVYEDSPYKIINDNNRTREVEEKGEMVERTIFSTLMYNSDTVAPVEDTFETTLSEYSDNNNCRWLTCCVFSKKDDGKKFIVTSTHWDLSGTAKEDRIAQARESANLTKKYAEKYAKKYGNLPVITTGDYNQTEDSDEIKTFLDESGYSEGKYVANKRGLATPTYHLGDGTGNVEDKEESSLNHWWYRNESTLLMRQYRADRVDTIDHLFISPNVQCQYYDVITESRAIYASDHIPSYVDVTI